jgi:predicted Zn-dependent protease
LSRRAAQQDRIRPFQMGMNQIYFQANRTFLKTDNLVLAFQLHGLTLAQREKAVIKYTFLKNGEPYKTLDRDVKSYLSTPDFIETFSLQEFSPAHYRVEVSLQIDGRGVLYEKGDFDVTHQTAIARPWIYAKLIPGSGNPVYSYMIGSQLYNKGEVEKARAYLEEAYRKNPDSIEFALNLARLYMNLKEFKLVDPLLQPFLDRPEPAQYEVHFILGRAYQSLSLLDKAIETFDKAIDQFGVNTSLLNAVGECYFQLGRYEEALVTWERSLEINPNQPELEKSVQAIKEKKNV